MNFSQCIKASAALLIAAPIAANAITFTETEWDLPDESRVIFPSQDVTARFFVSAVGQPSPSLAFNATITAAAHSSNGVSALVFVPSFAYDTALGEVDSISWSYRIRASFAGGGGTPLNATLLMIQSDASGDRIYGASTPLTAQPGVWSTVASENLSAASFGLLDFGTGEYRPDVNPDFAAPMLFGFGLGVRFDNDANIRSSVTFTGLYDNFTVTVTPVPEPGTWILLCGGVMALAMVRRARS